jgi:hypothetical protein
MMYDIAASLAASRASVDHATIDVPRQYKTQTILNRAFIYCGLLFHKEMLKYIGR